MAKNINVDYGGSKVPAIQLEFTSKTEPWAEYELEDGTLVRIKLILAQVFRVVDEFQPNGDPVYGLQIGNLPVFTIPQSLVRPSPTDTEESEK